MFLQLDRIRKQYRDKVAVAGLSLEVPRGVIYGIIGPNGAGKTTTIRMLMNITAPDSGTIRIEGKAVDDSMKNRVGYLPEERGLYKKTTVEEVIVFLGMLKGLPRATVLSRIDPWLEQMQLGDYRKKKVEELSKGMQQKLQFITTLIHEPDLVILDELFSGLDPLNMELIKGVVLELKSSGKTILFSTHVMEQAEKLCDYIAMISRGEKVLDGRMAEVKGKFGKNAIQVVIDGDGAFLGGLPGVRSVTPFTNYHELRVAPEADHRAILRAIVEKVPVRRFEVVEPSLYDIFIDLAQVDPSEIVSPSHGGDV